MKNLSRLCVALIASSAIVSAHSASFGDLDPTFNAPAPTGWSCGHQIASTGDSTLFVDLFGQSQNGWGVTKLRKDGSTDTSWGSGGTVKMPNAPGGGISPRGLLPLPDGGLIVVDSSLVRLTRQGAIDSSYGVQGISESLREGGVGSIHSFALQPDGGVVVLADGYGFIRIDSRGFRDRTFGPNGVQLITPVDAKIYAWSVQSNSIVHYGTYAYSGAGPLRPRLWPATFPVFEPSSRLIPTQGIASWTSPNVQVQPDGGVLFAANACRDAACNEPGVAVTRFRADGQLDPAFGIGGRQLLVPKARSGLFYNRGAWAHMLSLTPGGGMTVVGHGEYSSGGFFPARFESAHHAFRLLSDGTLDTTFENGKSLPSWQFSRYLQLADGSVIATQVDNCVQKLTGDAFRMSATMVEYRQPQLDHYFVTAEGFESGILDADTGPARWLRTGQKFGGWLPFGLPRALRVCRFYGDPQAGPNSHFYTLEGSECDGLRAQDAATPAGSPAWRFEGFAFSAVQPNGGACVNNLSPVYRLYNRGFERGLTPNHRYTSDLGVYTSMQAQGWAPEGVAFCVPPVTSNVGTYGY